MTSRLLADAARRFADHQSVRVAAAAASTGIEFATVDSVSAGAASDGNARVTVTWRGTSAVANGYVNSYTPRVGDRVVCANEGDQLVIVGKIIGQP